MSTLAPTIALNSSAYEPKVNGFELRQRVFSEVMKHYSHLKNMASALLSPEEAEDTVQDVLLEAWQNWNIHPFNVDALLDLLRHAIIARSIHFNWDCADIVSFVDCTEEKVHSSWVAAELFVGADKISELVMDAFEQLPKQYRDVLDYRFLRRESVRATARALDLSFYVLRERLHAAIRALRRQMREDELAADAIRLYLGD